MEDPTLQYHCGMMGGQNKVPISPCFIKVQ